MLSLPLGRRRRPGSRLRRALCRAAAGLWLWTAACPALAIEPFATDEPVQFKSDELTYDSTNKITEATGNVEAVQAGRRLLADRVIYNELQDKVTAIGNVTLYEPTGEVITAKSMELTGDLKNGVVEDLHAVLADGARLSAASGERKDGIITTAHDATYTACFPCAEDPSRPPLWQLRAVKVKENHEEKIIAFSHAWLEYRGIPFAYIPYIYQPDPTVKRKTGFLFPSFGQSSDLGFIIQAPYYIVISDNQDMTITPWITTGEGPVLEGEYRQALEHGQIDIGGSGTVDSNQKFLGHVRGEARYDFDENWRGGLDVNRASGRTYLRRYNFNYSRSLTSRLFAEDFIGSKDYFVGNAIAFENLDDDVKQRNVPYVAPWLDYFYVSDPDQLGGTTNVRLDTATLTRQEGTDSRRLSARGEWQRPFVGPLGDLFTVSTALWTDGYNVNDQTTQDRQNSYSGFSGRVFPQAGANWRLPLVRDGETVQQIVEPIAEVILAPNWGNPSRIPNEDSQDFELQEGNLFGFNRLPGIDVVDEGPRVNYGLTWTLLGFGDKSASAFVGQSYQPYQDNTFGKGTGLQDNVSDIVSSIDLVPTSWLDLIYRNRLDHKTLEFHRNELTARVGTDAARLRTTYVRYDGQPQNNLQGSEEIQYALDTRLTRFWRSQLFGITDIKSDEQRQIGARAIYEDECLLFSVEAAREQFKDGDYKPQTIVFFRVGFKTLGGVGAGRNAFGG